MKNSSFAPKLITPLPGPKAKAVVEADDRYMSPSYTRSYPLVAKRGRGTRIEDVDGNEFLDFAAGIAVTSTGHCHPEVVAAIQKQAGELIHMSGTDFYYEGMVQLAERMSAIAPMPGPHKFYYGNSGAEAVECALKLARYHTGRQQVIAFLGAFHGRTMGALSLTASKPQQKRRFFPMVPGVTHVRYPYAYRGCSGGPQEAEAFGMGCARYIEDKLFKTVLPPDMWSRQITFCRSCAVFVTATVSYWSPMKCSRARDAPANGGPSSMPAWSRTSFAAPRALPAACRSASV
jgi:4-aminobutyrate aminotransferase